MKKITFLGLALIALSINIDAQSELRNNMSFFVKGNLATQLHSYPNVMNMTNVHLTTSEGNRQFLSEEEFGTIAEPILFSPGFGVASKMRLNKFISFDPKLLYIQKGCKMPIESLSRREHPSDGRDAQNKFHYLSSDLILKISKTNYKKFQPSLYAGLRGDFLLWHKTEYDIDLLNHDPSGYTGFNRFDYGWIIGIGGEINRSWYFQVEVNEDFGYLIRSNILKVRNETISFNLGIYLNKIPRYKIIKADKL